MAHNNYNELSYDEESEVLDDSELADNIDFSEKEEDTTKRLFTLASDFKELVE